MEETSGYDLDTAYTISSNCLKIVNDVVFQKIGTLRNG